MRMWKRAAAAIPMAQRMKVAQKQIGSGRRKRLGASRRSGAHILHGSFQYCGWGGLFTYADGGGLVFNQTLTLHPGLLWGLAGFVVFVLAPNFGLPPELPGMQAGDLMQRQIWWLATVVLTAADWRCLLSSAVGVYACLVLL